MKIYHCLGNSTAIQTSTGGCTYLLIYVNYCPTRSEDYLKRMENSIGKLIQGAAVQSGAAHLSPKVVLRLPTSEGGCLPQRAVCSALTQHELTSSTPNR